MPNREVKLSQPLDQVAEVKKALRDLWRADELAEQAAVRIFAVFHELKFGRPLHPPPGDDGRRSPRGPEYMVSRLDRSHDQVGEARPALKDAAHQLQMLLQAGGFTLPNKK